MKSNFKNNSTKLYSQILVYITFSIVTTILIVTSILYVNFRNTQLSQIYSSSKDSLSPVGYSVDFMVDSAKSLMVQINSDPDISILMHYNNAATLDIQKAILKLSSYGYSMPFVHSLNIYNSLNDSFYTNIMSQGIQSSSSFFDKEIIKILNNGTSTFSFIPTPRKIIQPNIINGSNQTSNVFTFTFYDAAKISSPNSAVILNVSELWVRKVIDSLDINSQGSVFIINDEGKIVSSERSNEILTDISNEAYFKKIVNSKKQSGYFIENINGVKSLLIYVTNENLNWTFIRTAPYKNILGKIDQMTETTMFICAIILLIGLLSAYLISKKLYKPIDDIVSQLASLSVESRKNSYQVKQEFLRNLLKSETAFSHQEICKNFTGYSVNLDPDKLVLLIFFKIDHFSNFCDKYNFNDRSLIKFGILNITSEICSRHFVNEAVDMSDDQLVLLLNIDNSLSDEIKNQLVDIIKDIQTNVENHLKVSLSASISPKLYTIDNLNIIYDQVHSASFYRLFLGHKCIIYSDTMENKLLDYVYPLQKDRELTNTLMSGKLTDAKKILDDILNPSLIDYPIATFNSTLLRLTYSINVAIDTIESSSGIQIDYNSNNFISELNSLETFDDIITRFYLIFENITTKLEDRKSNKYDDLINKAIKIINSNYADPALCLENIADTLNMSSTYFGRLFKKYTMKSIAEYINDIRMAKSQALLLTTDLPVTDISEKTGFSSSNYFYSVFKKEHGITPNEFRQKPHLNNI